MSLLTGVSYDYDYDLPQVNLRRLSESAEMQLAGKPVAEHVLCETSPQSAQRRKFAFSEVKQREMRGVRSAA